jgi:hypothetical protein
MAFWSFLVSVARIASIEAAQSRSSVVFGDALATA